MKKVFIAATRQNVGKTLTALGLLGTLQAAGTSFGYIKPVGQRTVTAEGVEVDEDALLMKMVFHMDAELHDLNPIQVGKGYTADFIIRGQTDDLQQKIVHAYERVSRGKEWMVIEGTGHAGVGSVINLSNAQVAKALGASVVMVAPGGIGRPIDEIALNKAILDQAGVKLAGVIINKVNLYKYERIYQLTIAGFAKMGIPVLGVLPYDDVLSAPTVKEILEEMSCELVNREIDEALLDTPVRHNLVGAMSAHQALDYFKPGSLIITPGDREDIILAAIGMALSNEDRLDSMVAGIVLTGQTMPHPAILDLIHRSRVPVLTSQQDTYTVASQIHDLMVKIRPNEKNKIEHATQLISKYIDHERLVSEL